MRVGTKGRVTIPVSIRERFGLLPNTEVALEVVGNGVRLRKARSGGRSRRVVGRLRDRGDVPLTTSQILALTRR